MRPKPADNQNLLFSARLEQILDHNHPSFKLANAIDWSEFEEAFGKLYDPGQGRPAKPIRLMVGLHYLKHAYDLSDEDVVARWVENPYWQYFCGPLFFGFTKIFLSDGSIAQPTSQSLLKTILDRLFRCRLNYFSGTTTIAGPGSQL